MTPAERFAMCLAEAGFPGCEAYYDDGRIRWWPMPRWENDRRYWEAVWRAGELTNPARRPMCCRECWVADHVGNGLSDIGLRACEHVEVSA